MSTEGGTKAVVAAAAANSFIAVTKFGAWLLTGASSMLAEAIHSVADTGNQVLLLVGGKQAQRAATERHPFGYGRERYLAAFMVSIILFSIGGLFALYEAWHKYQEMQGPEHGGASILDSQWWWVPVAVLLAAIVAEGFSLRTAVLETNKAKGKLRYSEFVRRAKSPELPVILLEDVAALMGLVFALAGVGLTLLTKNLIFDVIGTALIGVLLVAIAVILAVETRSLLIGEAASPENQGQILEALQDTAGVESVIHLKTLHIGPEEILVATKIAVSPDKTAAEVATVINDAEAAVRSAVPMVTLSYVEPDIFDPELAAGKSS